MDNISKHTLRTQTSTRIWTRLSLQRYGVGLLGFAIILIGAIQWQQQRSDPAKELFFEGSIASAFQQAEEVDKLCLLYFETDFCYPCDRFVAESSQDDELWTLLTEEYLTLNLSAETEEREAQELMQRFQVNNFPTLLITDSDGQELHRFTNPNELQNLTHDLTALSRLRIAPKAPETTASLKESLEADALVEITADAEERFNGKLGVLLQKTDDYQVALHQAELIKHAWNRGIWIQSDGNGTFGLVIGSFETRKEAKLTARYLKKWNNESAKIVTLESKQHSFVIKSGAIAPAHWQTFEAGPSTIGNLPN